MTRNIRSCILIATTFFAVNALALAQTVYPAKPIRMIMPFPPGGPTDIVGRLVAAKLAEQIGQSVVADARPGASGNVGLEIASKAPPDGYTIVLTSPVIALSPLLYTKLNYDPHKDFAPIALVGAVRNLLAVHPSVPAKTLQELVQIARRNPGKLNYGSGGTGTTSHLAPELLKSLEKLDIVHVPYKGTGHETEAGSGGGRTPDQHAGRICQFHQERSGALWQGDQGSGNQRRLIVRLEA
jgi:tripartite-type tricarboxylate transporter receptor subunit TctC